MRGPLGDRAALEDILEYAALVALGDRLECQSPQARPGKDRLHDQSALEEPPEQPAKVVTTGMAALLNGVAVVRPTQENESARASCAVPGL
ncbi:MAG: hypothetical protein ACR2HY_01125 [Acidimicrobiales bacterium]